MVVTWFNSNGGSSFPYGGAGTYSSTVFSMNNTGGGGTLVMQVSQVYYIEDINN